MPDQFQYDVFLSHSTKEKPVVRELAERLRKDGLKVWFDEWVLKPEVPLAQPCAKSSSRESAKQVFPLVGGEHPKQLGSNSHGLESNTQSHSGR